MWRTTRVPTNPLAPACLQAPPCRTRGMMGTSRERGWTSSAHARDSLRRHSFSLSRSTRKSPRSLGTAPTADPLALAQARSTSRLPMKGEPLHFSSMRARTWWRRWLCLRVSLHLQLSKSSALVRRCTSISSSRLTNRRRTSYGWGEEGARPPHPAPRGMSQRHPAPRQGPHVGLTARGAAQRCPAMRRRPHAPTA